MFTYGTLRNIATSRHLRSNNDHVTRNNADLRYGVTLRANVTSVYARLNDFVLHLRSGGYRQTRLVQIRN
jgi:hypothetical protein